METFKKLLADTGQFSKEQLAIADQALSNIAGDHEQIYSHINSMCKAQDELNSLKSQLAGIVGAPVAKTAEPAKRKYERKTPPALPPPALPSESRKAKKESADEIKGNIKSLDEETIDL